LRQLFFLLSALTGSKPPCLTSTTQINTGIKLSAKPECNA
jgi:hypothetical protein